MHNFINIDDEINTYCKKKKEDIKEGFLLEGEETKVIMKEVFKFQKKIAKNTLYTAEQLDFIQQKLLKENEISKLYLEIERLKGENTCLNEKLSRCNKYEEKILKALISIIDEIYRLKYYADYSGDKNLVERVTKYINFIKRELKDLNLEIKSSLGEKFNEDFHYCKEVRKDLEKEDFTIIEELKLCIILEGKVIRPAHVVVIRN